MAPGKKYVEAVKKFDRSQLHEPEQAFELVKSMASRNFDETVEVAFKLGVDPRKADQMLRSTVSLPAGTGKDVRVVVFAAGDAANEARESGADVVGADDLVERVQGGFLDFDVAIATPDLMGQVGKLGRVLGPRGLMPNPKTGTVTTDVGKTVSDFKGGKVEYRTDRFGNVHVPIGKVSFPVDSLVRNYGAVLDEIQRAKPPSAKGKYLKGVTTSSTMGPGVKINPEGKAAPV
jgi:large subunit ribosomal protein L1